MRKCKSMQIRKTTVRKPKNQKSKASEQPVSHRANEETVNFYPTRKKEHFLNYRGIKLEIIIGNLYKIWKIFSNE